MDLKGPRGWWMALTLGVVGVTSIAGRLDAQEAAGSGAPRVTPVLEAPAPDPAEPAPAAPSSRDAGAAAAEGKDAKPGVGKSSMLNLVKHANPMLLPLAVCSVVAMAFALERLIALRRGRVIPRDFNDRFMDRLASGKIDRERALELCRANDCALARVYGRVVNLWGQPTAVLQDLADREVSGEVQDLKRNVRVLNATATLAPLLGLLGTVVGLIESFDSIGNTAAGGIGKNEALAHGISLALMATAVGLIVAVLSVVFYYFLLHRAETLGRGLEQESNRLIDLIASDGAGASLLDARR